MRSITEREEYVQRLLTAVPADMAAMKRFCFAVYDNSAKDPRKHDKLPARIDRSKPLGRRVVKGVGSQHGEDSFCDLELACKIFLSNDYKTQVSGIGFYFWEGDGLVGLDFDKVIGNPDNDFYVEVAKTAPKTAYAELSKSGDGLHIIGKDSSGITKGKREGLPFEIYSKGHYFLLTGKLFLDYKCNGALPDISHVVKMLLPDAEVVEERKKSGNKRSPEQIYPFVGELLGCLDPSCDNDTWVSYGISLGNFFKNTQFRKQVRQAFAVWSNKSKRKDHAKEWDKSLGRIKDFFDDKRVARDGDIGTIIMAAQAKGFDISKLDREVIASLLQEEIVVPADCGTEDPIPKINYKDNPVQVAAAYAKKDGEQTLILMDKMWWRYDKNLHHWIEVGDVAVVDKELEDFIKDRKYNCITVKGDDGKKKRYFCNDIKCADLTEVRKAAERFCVLPVRVAANTWFSKTLNDTRPNIAAMNNCLLDLQTFEAIPHTSKFFNTSLLPFDYDPDAVCPLWKAAMSDWFPKEPWVESELQKSFATTLINNLKYKNVFLFSGVTNSGKTVATNILLSMIGVGYRAAGDNKSLNGDFAFSDLDKAKVFMMEEFDVEAMTSREVAALKQMTGDGLLRINEKNNKVRYAACTARVFITTNTEPRKFKDPSKALAKRLVAFVFSSVEHKSDPLFQSKLEGELPGIFNWVLQGVKRLLGGERCLQPSGRGAALISKFKDAGMSRMESFVSKNLVFDRTAGYVSTRELFARFLAVCKKANEAPIPDSERGFAMRVSELIKQSKHLAEVEKVKPTRLDTRLDGLKERLNGYNYVRVSLEEENLLEEEFDETEWEML